MGLCGIVATVSILTLRDIWNKLTGSFSKEIDIVATELTFGEQLANSVSALNTALAKVKSAGTEVDSSLVATQTAESQLTQAREAEKVAVENSKTAKTAAGTVIDEFITLLKDWKSNNV